MSTQKETGLVSRAVREALGTLVSPAVAAQMVERALQTAGLGSIPEAGPALVSWVEGPLRAQVESLVGADAAELLAAQLAPVVAHARSGKHTLTGAKKVEKPAPIKPADKPGPGRTAFSSDQPTGVVNQPLPVETKPRDINSTARMGLSDAQRRALGAPRKPGSGPGASTTRHPQTFEVADPRPPRRVLAATSASSAAEALQTYLGSTARVEQVQDLVALLDALEEPSTSQPIVLVDCQRPTVHVTSIAAIGEDLPRGTTVVLWGSSESAWNELDRDRMPNTRWVRCSQEATPDDVGSLCAMLIG
ncbi:MAG: hypothetical protein ABW252_20610 [Polyangiales bacterium]